MSGAGERAGGGGGAGGRGGDIDVYIHVYPVG